MSPCKIFLNPPLIVTYVHYYLLFKSYTVKFKINANYIKQKNELHGNIINYKKNLNILLNF